MTRLVLASASPARTATLAAAGIDAPVRVSGVDEDAVLADAADRFGTLDPADAVLVLAQAKALAVAEDLESDDAPDALGTDDVIVLGCDSMLEIDGEVVGKPGDAGTARERWRRMRGRSATLHTGHWLVDLRGADAGGSGGTLGATSSTVVRFADLADDEIDAPSVPPEPPASVATGEPLVVAGAFTIDGLGGPFVTAVEGDPHGVVGLSLPLLRELLAEVGVRVHDLWRTRV